MWGVSEEDRRRRQRSGIYNAAEWTPANDVAAMSQPEEEEESGGFFGGLNPLEAAGNVAGAVGGFFGNILTDIAKTTGEAVGGAADIISAPFKQGAAEEERKKQAERTKQAAKDLEAGKISLDEANRIYADVNAKLAGKSKELSEDSLNKRDPVKTAAAAAETVLNVGTLGAGGAAKAAGKQVAKNIANETVEQTATRTLADRAAKEAAVAASRTSGGAAKKLGRNAAEAGTFGAAYGALAPLKNEGSEADPSDIFSSALQGGAIGGALGGAVSLLDRNVRAGLKQLPNDVRTGVLKNATEAVETTRLPARELTSYEGAPDKTRVEFYKNQIQNGQETEPIIAMRDSKGNLGIEDGKHRLQAYLELGIDDVPVKLTTPEQLKEAMQGGFARIPGRSNVDEVVPETSTATPATAAATATPESTFESFMQNLDTPNQPLLGAAEDRLMLSPGELPTQNVNQAKRQFAKTGEPQEFVNELRSSKKPIELGASSDELADIAMRETAGGKIKPVATNNAHISKEDVDAIKAIAEDDTGSAFTATRTPSLNLEEATRRRGGQQSKEFRVLDKFNTSIREHGAEYTNFVDSKRNFMERFVKEYGINGKSSQAMRPYLEAADDQTSKAALEAYRQEFGDKAAEGLRRIRDWWRTEKDVVRNETNSVIEKFAGKDRTMGDLGATYVPRVYKSGGVKGFRDSVLDVAHAGLDKIGGKKGMFNLENAGGYLSKETETAGGVLRGSEGIPLNSEMAKPNTVYLSSAQKRTANAPIQDMEDPLTSMMRYFEATGRAKYYTEDIARGRTLQKAIEMVNNETGNLRQMYQSFDDQINSVAGKTSRFDRYFTDSKTGNNFVNVASKLQRNIARSTILGSASSTLAQTGNLPLVVAEAGAENAMKGMRDMFKVLRGKASDPLGQSALMRTRYPKNENPFVVSQGKKAAQTGTDIVAKPFRIVERAISEFTWRAQYNRALAEGLTGKAAVQEADRLAAKVIGERSPGARAALYESKALGPVTAYTLEVNQMYQLAKQYFKRDPKKAAMLVGAIWLYNQGYQAITGNKLNADPLAAGMDAAGALTTSELDENGNPIGLGERLVRAGGRIAGEAIDATPLGGPVVGELYPEQGFRIPFAGGDRMLSREQAFGNTNFGRYGGGTPLASGLGNPLLLAGIPGMAQLQRSVEGNNAYEQGASMTPGGNLRFDIEQSPENYWRALLFGQYGTQQGRDYLAEQQARLQGQAL